MAEETYKPAQPEQVEADRIHYEQLVGHYRTDGSFKTDEQLRTQYVALTDGLIQKMTEGVEFIDPQTQEKTTTKPDVVVWLDKSARPVSWLTKELWPLLAKDKDGNVPHMPDFRYVNIDRQQWVNTIDTEGTGMVDINQVNPTIIRSLRSIFMPANVKQQGLVPDLDTAPTELDHKNVLIIDEVRSTGRTLQFARSFFEKAFPDARFATSYWMGGLTTRGQAVGNADLPVWYKEYDISGRGVSNRDERLSQRSASVTQRLGGWFLSTAFRSADPSSSQLRKEIKQLARDATNQDMLVVPSIMRDEADFEERAERLNSVPFEEFVTKKRQLDTQP